MTIWISGNVLPFGINLTSQELRSALAYLPKMPEDLSAKSASAMQER